ncbi:hypothetical protein PIIN_01755 [Serendipita indica DSM 11827]|uniref:DNA polymerase delta subunit 3 n=1 Tax=Serendipita indica (strain DSM 11827) TaxID=1109443 RepID=G4U3A9_SERID|nr:hypothetical protein PIIN_01755 [Serendipita indica DSM 11827]
MSDPNEAAINDYLTKQVKVNQNIVTYRLLSRALSIHVNAAKRSLAAFYEANNGHGGTASLHATYLVTGEDLDNVTSNDSMEVDEQQGEVQDAPSPMAEKTVRQKILIVPEENLESCKSTFKTDPSLLVTTVDAVRKMDASRTIDELKSLGIPISNACKVNKNIKAKKPNQTIASTSAGSKPTTKEEKNPGAAKSKEEVKPAPVAKSIAPKAETSKKQVGLDWSKAKSKDAPKTEASKPSTQDKTSAQKKGKAAVREASRGTKRPTPPDEKEDDKPPKSKPRTSAPVKTEPKIRAKKGVLLSDDEEEEEMRAPKAIKRKAKNENVVLAPRHVPGPPSSKFDTGGEDNDEDEEAEPSIEEDEPMETSETEEPMYAKTKRPTKKQKAWPMGANGLRKRRVVKTREYTDKRGFIQTEDYSEYESVDSESEQPPEPTKAKKKGGNSGTAGSRVKKEEPEVKLPKAGTSKESTTAKPKPKPGPAPQGGKKTIDSFFQKK